MATEQGFDREIRRRAMLWIGVALVVLGIVVSSGMLLLFNHFDAAATRRDPAASPLAEAARPVPAPSPQLLRFPERELARYRVEQQQALGSYGWVDAENGRVQIPIDRAVDWVANHGLPSFPEAAAAEVESSE